MYRATIAGGGPAGLMAAEVLAGAGVAVTVYDRMPSVGRKLLMAGRGGLNLTHAEALPAFVARYGAAAGWMQRFIEAFPPEALIAWCEGLGEKTFVGSSRRVFPAGMKASPLLRAWLRRLTGLGVAFRLRHSWVGWDASGRCVFDPPAEAAGDVTVLALGGASWPRLGTDGSWLGAFGPLGVPFRAANCGFVAAWPEALRARLAGAVLKRVAVRFGDVEARGDLVITRYGLEGTPVYALSSVLREAIAAEGAVTATLDLRPDLTAAALAARMGERRGLSLSNRMRRAGLSPAAAALVRLCDGDPAVRAKALPVRLLAPAGLERAISSAGGVRLDAVDERLMLRTRPGVFVAGEMLDWEAPTGGYLLQGCLSTGMAAARGALAWLGMG
jgi:uncharacterized flavoprotein (TIGR03862 family)